MAKRGRPSKKVMKKRQEMRKKSQRLLVIAILILIGFCVLSYFLITKQGF